MESAGSAQYKVKRFNFLIYLHIVPGNFSLRTKKSCRKRNPLVRALLKDFHFKKTIFYFQRSKTRFAQTFELKTEIKNCFLNS